MDLFVEWIRALPLAWRIGAIGAVTLLAHGIVLALRRLGGWVLTPADSPAVAKKLLERRNPKTATLTGLAVSGLTFLIYFLALGFVLRELTPITLGQYLASATVIGLAVGFGTQGLVQDIITGLTLIFSNTLAVGDLAEVAGQTGRVERIGLRFTTLTSFVGQTVYVPNRTIGTIGRYRAGFARAFLDVQLPEGVEEEEATALLARLATAFRAQHHAVIVAEPRVHTVQEAGKAGWRYLRIRFRIWPGQHGLIDGPFRQRVTAKMRELDPEFRDWMVTVTHRVHGSSRSVPPRERR